MSVRFSVFFLIFSLFLLPGVSFARASISDCDASTPEGLTDKTDLRAVMWNIVDDWEDFEDAVESYSGKEVDSRIYDEMDSGRVKCEYDPGIAHLCRLLDAPALVDVVTDRVVLCEDFLDFIEDETQKNRRACYAGILTEYHARGDLHFFPELLGRAAIEYWNDRFGSDMDYESCGL